VVHIVEHKSCSRAFWVDCELVRDAADLRAVFTAEVKEANRIEVQAGEEIAALELYLTDKLVDMKRPITVTAGGKTLYQGSPEGKVTVRLREGEPYQRVPQRPLWEELAEIRRQAAASQATRPAGSTQP
jgi:DNA-binding IclR family transcriptional regulator